MRILAKSFFALAPVVLACSTDFSVRTCKSDSDCEANQACAVVSNVTACVSAGAAPLRIGMSAPFGGPNHDLGAQMQAGISLAFNDQNQHGGGIRGRNLVLDYRNDLYDPTAAEANARDLLDVQSTNLPPRCPNSSDQSTALYPAGGAKPVTTTALDRGPNAVLAILGNVGTPTMVRFAPIAVETQTIFFGAFTGASLILRDDTCKDCKKYIFNVRASYAQEARATLEYFVQYLHVKDYQHLISFDQNDTYGQAGYQGLATAYQALQQSPPTGVNLPVLPDVNTSIPRFRYERTNPTGSTAVNDVINYIKTSILTSGSNTDHHTIGILMTDVYSAASGFIQGLRDWQSTDTVNGSRVTFQFSNVSFVGPNSLATSLKALDSTPGSAAAGHYTDNVYVSQVVPNYAPGQDDSQLVVDYRNLTNADPTQRNFTAFEGYISARIFIAGLLAQRDVYTSDSLVGTFENLSSLQHDSSLALGANSGFSPGDHNYSKAVWGTAIQSDGSFKNVYLWQQGASPELQLYSP